MSRSEESVATASTDRHDTDDRNARNGRTDSATLGVREGLTTVRNAFVDTFLDLRLVGVALLLLVCLGVLWSVISAVWLLVADLLGPVSSIAGLFLGVLAVVCVHATFSCYVAGRHTDSGDASLVGSIARVGRNLFALTAYAAATTGVIVGTGLVAGYAVRVFGLPSLLAALAPVITVYGWLVCTYYWTPLAVRTESLGTLVRENFGLLRRSWPAVVTCQAATFFLVIMGSLLFATGVGSVFRALVASVEAEVGPILASLGLAGPLAAILGVAVGAFAVPLLGVAYPLSRNAKYRLFERMW